eukprot:6106772-Amphidinium_carterae.2
MNLDGSPLVDHTQYVQLETDLRQLVEEKSASQLRQYSALDTRLHTLARDLEKTKTDLVDRHEENGSMFRKETMKFRDEVQARFGNDLDQRIRRQIEQYVKAASGADQGVRIGLYTKALNEVKESQTRSDQRCQAAEERCNQLVTEHLDTVARLERTIRELQSRPVKEQRDQGARPPGRGRSRGESGSPRTTRPVQISRPETPDSEGCLGGSPAPLEPMGVKLRQSCESMAFSLKANRESPSLGEVATDTEGSWLEDILLEPVRRSLVGEAERGSTKVYTTEDAVFKLHDIVIFQDLHHNIEAHRVPGHGSLIIDGPLRGSYPPSSEVRTLMGTERVYSNGTHFWIGNAGGVDYIAPLYGPSEAPRTPEAGSSNHQGSTPPNVPKFGASQQSSGTSGNNETPSPSVQVRLGLQAHMVGTPQTETGSPSAGSQGMFGTSGLRAGVPQTSPSTSQVRDVSPVNVDDERILAKYFTRGAQGRGEDNRAVILRCLEENSLTQQYPTDKEKWQNLEASLPKIPQLSTDPAVQ